MFKHRDTVYRDTYVDDGIPGIRTGRTVHTRSRVVTWDDWPRDVVETLRGWNRGKRLRFAPCGVPFQCHACERLIDVKGSTAAQFDKRLICDDCLIATVRRYGERGRAETEVEKCKRWQRGQAVKLRRYRHNAEAQARLLEALKEELSAARLALTMIAEEAGGPLVVPGMAPMVKNHAWCAGVAVSALVSIEEQRAAYRAATQ